MNLTNFGLVNSFYISQLCGWPGQWSGDGHLREDPGPPVAPCTPETLHKFNIVVLKLFRCKVTRQDDTWMENLDGLPDLLLPGLFLLRRPGKQLSVRRRWTKQRDCSSYCFISAAGKQKFVQQVQRCSSSSGAALGGLHFTTEYGFKLKNVPHGSSRPHCSQVLAGKT